MRIAINTILVSALLSVGCGPESATGNDATWVGTITTEGNVTTVVNESGSVWGGTARLVEEASIGVDIGDDEYMFGEITGVFATDEHIYVVDTQVPIVRMYTLAGEHVRDIGREGQGPGEYGHPGIVRGDDAGRIFLQDHGGRRFNVYSEDGEVLDTWPASDFVCCAFPMVPAPDGLLWSPAWHGPPVGIQPDHAAQAYGPNGPIGPVRLPRKPEFEFALMNVPGRSRPELLEFTPLFTWNISYSGALVAGASDGYRFEVQSLDGPTLMVEHYAKPTPVAEYEFEWHRRLTVSGVRRRGGSRTWNWDGAEMPKTKPAFSELIPLPSGDIWVARRGPSERVPECVEDPLEEGVQAALEEPCWRDAWLVDAFGPEGRYLGGIQQLRHVWPIAGTTFVRGDMVIATVEDDAGTIMVKRYRLVLPGDGDR